MIKVRLSTEAARDLDQIKEYISTDLDNPTAANRVIATITKRIGKLSDFPELGVSLSAILPIETDYRLLVCGNYLAFYLYEQNKVLVDRVLYGKRDFAKVLFGEQLKPENGE